MLNDAGCFKLFAHSYKGEKFLTKSSGWHENEISVVIMSQTKYIMKNAFQFSSG